MKPLIHSSAIVEGPVDMADDVEIGALCYVKGPVSIGPGSRLWPHVIVGTDGEHKSSASVGSIRIGSNTIIRELTVIQRGTGDRETTIGDGVMVMDHGHVAHDCVVGNDVTLSPNVTIGGHSKIHTGATMGIGSMTHQRTVLGSFCMIGMGSVVTKDVPPFVVAVGNPARFMRLNTHALERLGIRPEDIQIDSFGIVGSSHPLVLEALDKFRIDSRRAQL